MIRAIAFDFDGTLVDSNPIKRSAFYEVVAGIPGAAQALDQILKSPGSGDRYDIFRALGAQLGPANVDPDALVRAYGAKCEAQILNLLGESPATAFLDALKSEGYALFVVSATPKVDLVSMLKKTPLASRFEAIFGGPISKAEILRDIARRHGWTMQQMIMVGDGQPDCRAAAAVGCRFVGVGDDAAVFGGRIDVRIDNVEQLANPEILRAINAVDTVDAL